MLSCHLSKTSNTPMYEQLYLYIKNEIIEGRIPYGAKLPSKRRLADFLKISQNTIESAYDQLVAEGYIKAIPRKGYFVMAYEDLEYVAKNEKINIPTKTEEIPIHYDFHPSAIDTENFPFSKWRKYAKDTITKENQSLLLLGDPQGEVNLRQEIAKYLYFARGVQCSPEQIIVGAGSEILLQQLLQLFDKNMVYGIEDPGYHVILRILKNLPNEICPLQVDHEGVKVDLLDEKNINIVYVTPSHHFPFGTVLSVNRRTKLLKWAIEREDRYIIEDDYDSEFRYVGKSIPSLQSMDIGEKVIYLGTFSKSLMPSMRISYMVLPKKLLYRYNEKFSYFHTSTVSRMDQHILTQFLKEGDFERHLNRMRKIYRRKLEKVLDRLKPYEKDIEIIGGHSGFHVVLVVKNGMGEEELVERALAKRIKIYPLSKYSLEKKIESPPKIVLGFAGIPEKNIEEAVLLLLESWNLNI